VCWGVLTLQSSIVCNSSRPDTNPSSNCYVLYLIFSDLRFLKESRIYIHLLLDIVIRPLSNPEVVTALDCYGTEFLILSL
jgi:hypothetical protein